MTIKFIYDPDRVVHEGSNFVIYDIIDLLPTHPNYPHGTEVEKPNGKRAIPASWKYGDREVASIVEAWIHQTAGSYTMEGFEAAMATAGFIVRDPTYDASGKWLGTGRGWPAMCYSYYVPSKPERTPDGKIIIFKCRPDGVRSWHTPGGNRKGIAIGFQGYFRSRHMGKRFKVHRGDPTGVGEPSTDQIEALKASWEEFFKPKYGLRDNQVNGHFQARKPKLACPGNYLELWVLNKQQGVFMEEMAPVEPDYNPEPFITPFVIPGAVTLIEWSERQAALLLLGFNLGKYGPLKNGVDDDPGDKTRAAIEGFQREVGTEINGIWDEQVEFFVQLSLMALGKSQADLNGLLP